MTDLELLEAAAKAAGYSLFVWGDKSSMNIVRTDEKPEGARWNPLDDDGDALRLATKLRLSINFDEFNGDEYVGATPRGSHQGSDEVIGDDERAATRRAIVMAAASLATKK